MARQWNVVINERPYLIEMKGNKIFINNEMSKLKSYPQKRTWLQTEVHLKVADKDAMLVISSFMGGMKLIIDGRDCATGEQYVALKLPKWSYIFIALQCVNFINGALGAVIAVVCVSATIGVSANGKMNTVVKVLLDLLLLLAALIAVFAIALAIYSI